MANLHDSTSLYIFVFRNHHYYPGDITKLTSLSPHTAGVLDAGTSSRKGSPRGCLQLPAHPLRVRSQRLLYRVESTPDGGSRAAV